MRSTGDRAENYRDSTSSRPYFTIPTSCDPRRGLSYRLFRTCEGRKESHTKTQRWRPESASSRRDRAKRFFKATCEKGRVSCRGRVGQPGWISVVPVTYTNIMNTTI